MPVRTAAAAGTVATLLLAASVGMIGMHGAPPSAARNDCADIVARGFERQHLGQGAWACLSPDKQDELSAAGIDDDAALAQLESHWDDDYDVAAPMGSAPRVGRSPIRVFLLTRAVPTHELVGRQLRPATERESKLLLVSLDSHGKVDEFGVVNTRDEG